MRLCSFRKIALAVALEEDKSPARGWTLRLGRGVGDMVRDLPPHAAAILPRSGNLSGPPCLQHLASEGPRGGHWA